MPVAVDENTMSRSQHWRRRLFSKGKRIAHDASAASKGGPAPSSAPHGAVEETDALQHVAGTGIQVNNPDEAVHPAAPGARRASSSSSSPEPRMEEDATEGAGATTSAPATRTSVSDNGEGSASEEASAHKVDRIEFYRRDQPYFWLSNASEHDVFLDGIRYPTAEHLFQSLKFLPHRPDLANKIRKINNPADAIREARKHTAHVKKGWIGQGRNLETMRLVLLLKFSQHTSLSRQLLLTGDADLIEASPTDAFWGAAGSVGSGGIAGLGRNELGKALRRTRETIRAQAGLGAGSGAQTV